MSVKALLWAFQQEGITANEKLVLLALANVADHEGVCWPGREYIAAYTGLAIRTVSDTVGKLCVKMLITREARGREGMSGAGRTTNLYRLNLDGITGSRRTKGRAADARNSLPYKELPGSKTPLTTSSSSPGGDRDVDLVVVNEGEPEPGKGADALVAKVAAVLARGRKSWDLPAAAAEVWDELGPPGDLQARVRFLADYVRIMDGSTERISFARLGRLARRWGKVALRGLDVALAADAEDPYTYAEKVCQEAAQRMGTT